MNPYNEPNPPEKNSKILIILIVVFFAILALVFTLIFFFKPKAQNFDNKTGGVKNTPKEQIELLDPVISRVYNLTDELRLFDELFDELVYAETPDVNNIGNFVSGYRNYAARYSGDRSRVLSDRAVSGSYDTTIISFDRQQKYLKSCIETLLESIEKKKKVFMTIPVSYPVKKEDARIVSGFGMRDHPILKERRMHNGIDITAPVGTAVMATANGKVIMTEDKPGYGRSCMVEHKFGYQTLYGHMVRLVVGENNWLQKGDVVGYVGNTGLSEAPHLHYEIRKNGKPLNPSYLIFEGLNKEEYKEVIVNGSKTNEILSF